MKVKIIVTSSSLELEDKINNFKLPLLFKIYDIKYKHTIIKDGNRTYTERFSAIIIYGLKQFN